MLPVALPMTSEVIHTLGHSMRGGGTASGVLVIFDGGYEISMHSIANHNKHCNINAMAINICIYIYIECV